uniref:Uncharacterized protein n=1 Tax=Anguilla anguilla TaxID=7936 RepID=A0A0E9PHE1_ANGAN
MKIKHFCYISIISTFMAKVMIPQIMGNMPCVP